MKGVCTSRLTTFFRPGLSSVAFPNPDSLGFDMDTLEVSFIPTYKCFLSTFYKTGHEGLCRKYERIKSMVSEKAGYWKIANTSHMHVVKIL